MPKIFNASAVALPHVAALDAYVPGEQPPDTGWIKLNTNENPFPPSPAVEAALRAELASQADHLRLYPLPTSRVLRETVAAFHGLEPSQVLVSNGSDDALNLLARTFCDATHPAGTTVPSYSLYPVLVALQNAPLITLEFDRSFSLDVDRIATCGANVFFLTAPNAPSGVAFPAAQIAQICERFPGLLVVDEAYAPFARENAVGLLNTYPNLVVTRSFSKVYGLAGCRVGYALGHPDVIGLLDRVRDSYNVDRLAQVAAVAALRDVAYYRDVIQKIVRTRDTYVQNFRARGWFTYESQANFIFTEPVDASGRKGAAVAKALFDFLRGRKFLIRYFGSHPLTKDFLRISVGTESEMKALTEAIDAWLHGARA